jgi:pyruvate kinase
VHSFFAAAAIDASNKLPLKGILVSTRTGFTARLCAAYRDRCAIYAVSESRRTVRELALTYGVKSLLIEKPTSAEEAVCIGVAAAVEAGWIKQDDMVVFICGTHKLTGLNNFLHVGTPEKLICPICK